MRLILERSHSATPFLSRYTSPVAQLLNTSGMCSLLSFQDSALDPDIWPIWLINCPSGIESLDRKRLNTPPRLKGIGRLHT